MSKKTGIILLAFALPFGAQAQLAKLMSKYHEKNCITVTQLDKNLYGLYKKQNLPPEAEEALQNLEAVNILNLDLSACDPDMENKVTTHFKAILDSPNKYRLVKSRTDASVKQMVYSQSKNGQITSLVVWNQSPEGLDIIELCGKIQPEQIASLPNSLNIQGLNSLSSFAPAHSSKALQQQKFEEMKQRMQQMKQQQEQQRNRLERHRNPLPDSFFDETGDMDFDRIAEEIRKNFDMPGFGNFPGIFNLPFGNAIPDLDSLFNATPFHFPGNLDSSFFTTPGTMVSGNSIQITNTDGKTKIKINSNNSDIRFVIDGKELPKGDMKMPENIGNVQIVQSKDDIRKSYLLITSGEKLGQFTRYTNGILTFQYEGQEYVYNLKKVDEPILVIDGLQTKEFSVDPASILQIRPQSKLEKEIGYFPSAEVIIHTK